MNFKFTFKKKEKADRITALEKRIFSEKKTEKKSMYSILDSFWIDGWSTPKTLEDRMDSFFKKCLDRPEWSEAQREFFREKPEMAVLSEMYLQELDAKIANLEAQRARNPFCVLKNLFRKLLTN